MDYRMGEMVRITWESGPTRGNCTVYLKKKKYYYYYLKLKYNTFKPKYCIKQFIIIVTAVKAKKTESEL